MKYQLLVEPHEFCMKRFPVLPLIVRTNLTCFWIIALGECFTSLMATSFSLVLPSFRTSANRIKLSPAVVLLGFCLVIVETSTKHEVIWNHVCLLIYHW